MPEGSSSLHTRTGYLVDTAVATAVPPGGLEGQLRWWEASREGTRCSIFLTTGEAWSAREQAAVAAVALGLTMAVLGWLGAYVGRTAGKLFGSLIRLLPAFSLRITLPA